MRLDFCYFVTLPMFLFVRPISFVIASLISLAASAATYLVAKVRDEFALKVLSVPLILGHVGWAVITCFQLSLEGSLKGDAIRVDLVLLAPSSDSSSWLRPVS